MTTMLYRPHARRAYCLFFFAGIILALMLALGGCAGNHDVPLPVVHSDDPTLQLTPDHLNYGEMPL